MVVRSPGNKILVDFEESSFELKILGIWDDIPKNPTTPPKIL